MAVDREQLLGTFEDLAGIRIIAVPKISFLRPQGPASAKLVAQEGVRTIAEEMVIRKVIGDEVLLGDPREETTKYRTTLMEIQRGGDQYFDFQPAPDDTPASKSDGLTL
jgi:hypothetical protein